MSITEKLMRIQTEIKAPKNLYNSFGKYKYRNAEGICEAVKPYLQKENCALTLTDEIVEVGGRVYVKAKATLLDTERDSSICVYAMAREAEEKKGMDDSQITGTASSYARKYALNGLFLLDDTKDADTDEYKQQIEGKKEQEQDEKKTEEVKKSKPTTAHIKTIQALAEKKGYSEANICNLYKKKKYTELTFEEWHDACNKLNEKPDKEAK